VPLAKLKEFQQRMRWTFPWASARGGDFNFDFNVSLTEAQQRAGGTEYNYRHQAAKPLVTTAGPVAEVAAMTGTDVATYTRERPGMSAFVLAAGAVYHTYSTYARGLDGLWGMYQWLDRAPRRDATRRVSGGATTTPTASAKPSSGAGDRRPTGETAGRADRGTGTPLRRAKGGAAALLHAATLGIDDLCRRHRRGHRRFRRFRVAKGRVPPIAEPVGDQQQHRHRGRGRDPRVGAKQDKKGCGCEQQPNRDVAGNVIGIVRL